MVQDQASTPAGDFKPWQYPAGYPVLSSLDFLRFANAYYQYSKEWCGNKKKRNLADVPFGPLSAMMACFGTGFSRELSLSELAMTAHFIALALQDEGL